MILEAAILLRAWLVPVVIGFGVGATAMVFLLAGWHIVGDVREARRDRLRRRYEGILRRALDAPDVASALAAANPLYFVPRRQRALMAEVLLERLRQVRGSTVDRARSLARDLGLLDQWRREARAPSDRQVGAVRALGLIHDRDSMRVLTSALDDPHPDVRTAACDALGAIGDPRAVDQLVACIHDESRHQRVRVIEALRRIGPSTTAALVVLGRADARLRHVAAEALASIGGADAQAALLEWTDDEPLVAAAAWAALVRVGLDDRAAYRALRALTCPEARVRVQAARAIGQSGREDFARYLVSHLDGDWDVAASGARALARLGEPGRAALRARVACGVGGHGLALARQMLWEAERP